MRFIERAIKALSYHRWLYCASALVVFGFTLISVSLLTANQLNLNSQTGFNTRLNQFDTDALRSAKHLVAQVTAAYTQVSAQYQTWWWDCVIGLAIIAAGFALGAAHHRRQETTAYLLVGKHPVDIIAQYLLENVITFTVGFVAALAIALCLTRILDSQLIKLNLRLLDTHLSNQVSATTYRKLTTQLFAHRITDFSGGDLVSLRRAFQPFANQLFGKPFSPESPPSLRFKASP